MWKNLVFFFNKIFEIIIFFSSLNIIIKYSKKFTKGFISSISWYNTCEPIITNYNTWLNFYLAEIFQTTLDKNIKNIKN